MALIFCPECKKQISSFADICPSCGFPINTDVTMIYINTSYERLAQNDAYVIYNSDKTEIARLRPGESFSKKIPNRPATYYAKRICGIDDFKPLYCEAGVANIFELSLSPLGYGFNVTKTDVGEKNN